MTSKEKRVLEVLFTKGVENLCVCCLLGNTELQPRTSFAEKSRTPQRDRLRGATEFPRCLRQAFR